MKKLTIAYRITHFIFAFAMLAIATAKLMQAPPLIAAFQQLGYPNYLLMILGIAYIIGVIALLQTKCHLLQEWAYAGFSIAFIGAIASHLFAGDPLEKIFPASFLLILMLISYSLRNKLSAA